MKRSEFALFCTVLNTLLEARIPMEKALQIISRTKKTVKSIRSFALFIADELQNGSAFSSVIGANPYISVPGEYTSLFYAEEKTGSIAQTLSFISSSEIRRKESFENILRSALYPAIIILLSTAGSLLVLLFRQSFGIGLDESVFYTGFIVSSVFILVCIIMYMVIAFKIFTDNALFLFFFTCNFLLDSGFDTYTSLEYTALQYPLGSSARKKITECASLVSKGCSFFEAAASIDFFPETFLMLCEYAVESGDIKHTVKNGYEEEVKRIETKRKMFTTVSEPCMIICAGIYLLILVQYTVLPVLTNFGGVL